MISAPDFVHLPYTRDLTEGGIAYALHSLPYSYQRIRGFPVEGLRRVVADAAVELAFRRYLGEQDIPFATTGAAPFREPGHYDVLLAGRRCELHSFFISHRQQVLQLKHEPQILLKVPALVASDLNAAEGHSTRDLYLFAFLSGLVTNTGEDLQKVLQGNLPVYFVHVMPDSWMRPAKWNPLGTLVLKSDSEQPQTIEIGGQDAGREMRSLTVEIPPKTRIQVEHEFFSLAYLHSPGLPDARLGIHSPVRKQTYVIEPAEWGNIWVYGTDLWLTGYLTREEFNQRASFVREGARVFQFERTRTKNLAVNVCDLKPVSDLLAGAKDGPQNKGD